MRLLGVPVADEDLRALAGRLSRALDDDVMLLALEPEERDLLFTMLEDPSEGLHELRGVLANDVSYRHGLG